MMNNDKSVGPEIHSYKEVELLQMGEADCVYLLISAFGCVPV